MTRIPHVYLASPYAHVTAEIAFAEERGIPVRYVRYGPNDGTGDGLTFDGPRPIPGLERSE